jgi:hypothetical protein
MEDLRCALAANGGLKRAIVREQLENLVGQVFANANARDGLNGVGCYGHFL